MISIIDRYRYSIIAAQLYCAVGEEDAVFTEGDNTVGRGVAYATDRSGIKVIYAIFIMLYRRVGMTKQEDACIHIFCEGYDAFRRAFYTMCVAVEKDDFLIHKNWQSR